MKIAVNKLVQTGQRFAKIVGNARPLPGVPIRPLAWNRDAWVVRLDGFEKPQPVHAGMLEEFTMELETTTEAWDALPEPQRRHLDWGSATEGTDAEWRAVVPSEKLPARIRRMDERTFSVYRDGKYLGSEATLDSAKMRAALGAPSQKNRVMRMWEREHPGELPPGLQLTDAERAEYWRVHAASKPTAGICGRRNPMTKNALDQTEAVVSAAAESRVEKKPRERSTVPGGNAAKIAELLRRKQGCTREDVLAATGWTAVSMQQQAKQAGLALRVDKGRKPFRYYGGETK